MPRVFLLLCLLFLAACQSARAPLAPEASAFRETVERHVAAISARDLDGLLATVTDGERLTLIFPDGSRLATRQQYVDFHVGWFGDPAWTMEIDIVDLNAVAGTALVRTTYEDDGPECRRSGWLALVFAKEDGLWRLVHDQNTRIPAGE